jgi:hypothetical protein
MKQKNQEAKYSASFSWKFDKEEDDAIVLTIEISDKAKNTIRQVACLDESLTNCSISVLSNRLKRYKARAWLFRSLGSYREALFIKELLDSNKVVIKFDNLHELENFMLKFKDVFKECIKLILTYGTEGDEIKCEISEVKKNE